jgi:hypothetical protein
MIARFLFLHFELQHPETYARLFFLGFNVVHDYCCQYVTPTCHFDTRSNATGWMFNRVSEAWGYHEQARNAYDRIKDLLGRYWKGTVMYIGYWQVDYESESESLKLTRVACVPSAGRAERWATTRDNIRVINRIRNWIRIPFKCKIITWELREIFDQILLVLDDSLPHESWNDMVTFMK